MLRDETEEKPNKLCKSIKDVLGSNKVCTVQVPEQDWGPAAGGGEPGRQAGQEGPHPAQRQQQQHQGGHELRHRYNQHGRGQNQTFKNLN